MQKETLKIICTYYDELKYKHNQEKISGFIPQIIFYKREKLINKGKSELLKYLSSLMSRYDSLMLENLPKPSKGHVFDDLNPNDLEPKKLLFYIIRIQWKIRELEKTNFEFGRKSNKLNP